jgi:hypothetical protein
MTAPNNPKVANLAFSTSPADNTLVAAVTGQEVVVWKISFTIDAAAVITFYDGASTTTPLSGGYKFTGAGSMVLDGPEGFPLWRTARGNALIATLSAGVNVGGNIWYTLE